MTIIFVIFSGISALATVTAAVFAFLAWRRSRSSLIGSIVTADQISQLLRAETDRTKQFGDDHARGLREEIGGRIDTGVHNISAKLDQDIARMGEEANRNRETLRQIIEGKLDSASEKQGSTAKDFREQMTLSFESLATRVGDGLREAAGLQKERLESVTNALGTLSEKHEKAQEALRLTIEGRLDVIRGENATKLEEMRKTVDEKLQSTLEARLGESFNRVVEHLERVHKGIGEMQVLATSVGDLKKVFSNVKVRGVIGEIHLEMLLDQYLASDQFLKNAQVKEGSQERVEFAIKLHHHDAQNEWLLPVDVKFPREDYDRLTHAVEINDIQGIADAGKALENQIKLDAKTIHDKYISPPRTTDFAILFLPTEGLYAEAMRRPGLFESINRDYGVMLTGPSTFTALLNSLQMGFRAVAIAKRSTEVWKLLGAVQNEFSKYGKVVETLGKQLDTARQSVDKLGVRTRVMTRTLRDVDKLPDESAKLLLTSAATDEDDGEEFITLAELNSADNSEITPK